MAGNTIQYPEHNLDILCCLHGNVYENTFSQEIKIERLRNLIVRVSQLHKKLSFLLTPRLSDVTIRHTDAWLGLSPRQSDSCSQSGNGFTGVCACPCACERRATEGEQDLTTPHRPPPQQTTFYVLALDADLFYYYTRCIIIHRVKG